MKGERIMRMMSRAYKIWGAVCIMIALLAGGALWFGMQGMQTEQTVTLSDGTSITLKRIAFGKEHYPPGSSWESFLRLLPEPLTKRFGRPARPVFQFDQPELVIWLEWPGYQAAGRQPQFTVENQAGYIVEVGHHQRKSTSSKGKALLGVKIETFPRRDDQFKLRIYGRDQNHNLEPLGHLSLANPLGTRTFAEWNAKPLPQSGKAGDLVCTLKKLVIGEENTSKSRRGNNPLENWCEVFFRVMQNGELTHQWKPVNVELSDATGNRLASSARIYDSIGEEEVLKFRPYLWPNEPAWKLRVEFCRKETAEFAEHELWTVPGIAIPAPKSYTACNVKTNLLGSTVEVIGLAGNEGSLPGGYVSHDGSGALEVRVTPMPEGLWLSLTGVTDDKGREVPCSRSSWGGGHHRFRVELPEDADQVVLQLALHRSRFVEFLAAPESKSFSE